MWVAPPTVFSKSKVLHSAWTHFVLVFNCNRIPIALNPFCWLLGGNPTRCWKRNGKLVDVSNENWLCWRCGTAQKHPLLFNSNISKLIIATFAAKREKKYISIIRSVLWIWNANMARKVWCLFCERHTCLVWFNIYFICFIKASINLFHTQPKWKVLNFY